MRTHVCLGDGAAGMSAARAIRLRRPDDRVIVVSDDPQPFYYRAALTNYLLGEAREDELWALPPDQWDTLRIERRTDRAMELDLERRRVSLRKEGSLSYDTLLIATGARANRVRLRGATSATHGILVLRTLRDAQQIVERATKARRAVVIGGGILGIEAAQGLHARGVAVTLVHRGEWLLEKMLDRVGGELVRTRMERDGVRVLLRNEVQAVQTRGQGIQAVRLKRGDSVRCELCVQAIGIVPNTEWLDGSGLALHGRTIPVDRRMQVAGAPNVFAAGDLAHFVDDSLPFRNATGLWQPAVKQGMVAGFNMADAQADDQYRPGAIYNATRAWDLDVVTIGDHIDSEGEVITWRPRGTQAPVVKKALLREGRLRGVALLGDRREGKVLQRLMNLRGEAANVRSIADRLFDPQFDLVDWVAAQESAKGVLRYDHDIAAPIGPLPQAKVADATLLRHNLAMPVEGQTALLTSASPGAIHLTLDGTSHRFKGPDVQIGTAANADIRLASIDEAQWDVRLRLEGMVWMLLAPASRRTWVIRNGRPVTRRVPIGRGDVLQVGPHRLVADFARRSDAAPTPPAAETVAWLVSGHARHPLTRRCTVLGAGSDSDIVVPGDKVSRSHAQVLRQGSPAAFYLVDAGSTNGTSVNGEPLQSARKLRAGDRIDLSGKTLEFVESQASLRQSPDAPTVASGIAPAGFLVARRGPLRGQSVPLPTKGSLGRGRAADVRIDDPLLSRVHVRFEIKDERLTLEDMGTENGTFVRDQRVESAQPTSLSVGDRVRMGRSDFEYRRFPTDASQLFEADALDAASADAATVQLSSHTARLEEHQSGAPALHPLTGDTLRIGRAQANDLVLTKKDVSREHCRLNAVPTGHVITDFGSRYGTHINGIRMQPEDPIALNDGDTLQVGERTTFRYRRERAKPADATATLRSLATLAPVRPAFAEKMPTTALTGDGPWVLGRQASACAAPIPFDTVSRTHCVIQKSDRGFSLTNLSPLGTLVNQKAAPDEGRLRISDGDILTLQDVDLRFRVETPHRETSDARKGVAGFAGEPTYAHNPLEQDLSAAVRQELDACIGCHECMRACPLPEAEDVTIAALNAYAGGLGEPAKIVSDFVQSCTQCHACVPVCPADIRRSRMVLWNKLKRVPRPEECVTLQVGDRQSDSSLTLGDASKQLGQHDVFASLPKAALLTLLGSARFRQLRSRELLIGEGEYPDALWVILTGELEIGMAAMKRKFLPMTTLGAGQTVAEVALLAAQPMDHGVRAASRTLVVGLTKYALTAAREQHPAFAKRLESLYLSSATSRTLGRLDIGETARDALRRELLPERFSIERVILSRVEARDTVGIVHRGFVREVRRTNGRERVANYLKPGDVFGGSADDNAADLLMRYEAATQVEVFTVHRERIASLDQRHAGVRDALLPQPDQRKAKRSAIRDLGEAGSVGMLQATQLLVIDTRICVDCNNCVDACERRHGAPRLERQNSGLQQGPYQVPSSCFHCVDPVCLFCAVDGIVREVSGEIRIVEDNCIGCGACAERCPYDNIFMRPRTPERKSIWQSVLPASVQRVLRIDQGRVHLDVEDVAIKCDLCADYHNGPACVRSCPVGAAIRANPVDLFGVGRGD